MTRPWPSDRARSRGALVPAANWAGGLVVLFVILMATSVAAALTPLISNL